MIELILEDEPAVGRPYTKKFYWVDKDCSTRSLELTDAKMKCLDKDYLTEIRTVTNYGMGISSKTENIFRAKYWSSRLKRNGKCLYRDYGCSPTDRYTSVCWWQGPGCAYRRTTWRPNKPFHKKPAWVLYECKCCIIFSRHGPRNNIFKYFHIRIVRITPYRIGVFLQNSTWNKWSALERRLQRTDIIFFTITGFGKRRFRNKDDYHTWT